MARARFAAYATLMLVLVMAATAGGSPRVVARLAAAAPPFDSAPLATVGWLPSTTLLVAEVVTGGASASDEYVEVTNGALIPLDLAGLEIVYVTSSGGTITRKATWTSPTVLEPGRHLLVANALGIYADGADATYSGGFAATGGTVVLRQVGGEVIDAVGWGDATNAFVEGVAAAAPPPGSSIERAPGGTGGNTTDTNVNASDFVVNPAPVAQNLAAAPTPAPAPSPTPVPPPTADPSSSPSPVPSATAPPSPLPSPTPAPTSTPAPSPSPSVTPTPTPTGSPTPSPSPTTTPSPSPLAPQAIAEVRGLTDGTSVLVEGTLTTELGALEAGRTGFVQDETAGIALYLDAALAMPIPAGTVVRVGGVLDSRYAQRTIRVVGSAVEMLGTAALPLARPTSTGAATEPFEGLRLELTGTVTEAPATLADGVGLMVDDGSGPVRVIVGPDALGDASPVTGAVVRVTGPLGQRDSGGTGLAGYRLFGTLPGELTILPVEPSPSPSPSPSPTSSPAPSGSPSPGPSPTSSPAPTPSPTATPSPILVAGDIAEARTVTVGGRVTVQGVVIAEAGRLGTPSLLAIGDGTGGLPVRLPDGVRGAARGARLEVRGIVAQPYGQTELRAEPDGITLLGGGTPPGPLLIDAGAAGEAVEGRLVQVQGTITVSASKATSGDLAFTIQGADGALLRVMADGSAGLDAAALRKGVVATFTGIVGQRASRKGALDGYRVWLRDALDVAASSFPALTAGPSNGPTTDPGAAPVSIAAARRLDGGRVIVEGVLTVGPGLLDATDRRIVVEDDSGAVEVYLAAPEPSLRPGLRVRVTGTMGQAYGATRLRAEAGGLVLLGPTVRSPRSLRSAPAATDEWRLVRLTGVIATVHRLGDRWLAELDLGGTRVPVTGLAGSGIPAADLAVGRRATVTGVVRRPYPNATDRRLAVVPRAPADVVLGLATVSGGPVASGHAPRPGIPDGRPEPIGSAGLDAAPEVNLDRLAEHVGQRIRIGGLVATIEADGVRLDDGTAAARLVLEGDAAALIALLEPGDALNATGVPARRDELVLVVTDPGDLVLAGATGAAIGPGSAVTPIDVARTPVPASAAPSRLTPARGLDLGPAPMGFGTLSLVGVLSLLVAAIRRYHGRRSLRKRVLVRLAALVGSPLDDQTADHGVPG